MADEKRTPAEHPTMGLLTGSMPVLRRVFQRALQVAGVAMSAAALSACASKVEPATDAASLRANMPREPATKEVGRETDASEESDERAAFERLMNGGGPILKTNTRSGTFADEPGFVPTPCRLMDNLPASLPPGYQPKYLEDLRPSTPVDAIELWRNGEARERWGIPCSHARDVAACKRRLEALPDEPTFELDYTVQISNPNHLRATRGDEVVRVGTVAELKTFLGAIDSLGDAQLWVESHHYSLACGQSGARAVANGIDVLAFTWPGCDGRERHLLHVSPDGALSTLDEFVERQWDLVCIAGRRPEGLCASAGELR